jgi:NADH-quinone oxidoreductase subunit G
MVREGAELLPASWDKALAAAASALKKAGNRVSALAGGTTTNEEAFLLQQLLRDDLGSSHLSARIGGEQPLDVLRALADPKLQASVPDLEFAHTVLLVDCDPIDEAPVWDLRIRKGIRRHHTKVVVASARPTALDPVSAATLRFAPGGGEAFLVALDAALSGDEGNLGGAASAAGSNAQSVRDLAALLQGDGEGERDIVIVASERTLTARGAQALVSVAARLGLGHDGAGLLVVPSSTNARGIREAGFAGASGSAVAGGDHHLLYLLHADPLRDHPDRAAWDRALGAAATVIAHESVMTDTVREHADVVFPAEAYPEKDGTLTHPDGLLQRLRPGVGRPGSLEEGVRAGWAVLAELARRAGIEAEPVLVGATASQQLFAAVYPGMTLDLIAGQGARPQRPAGPLPQPRRLDVPRPGGLGDLRVGTWRPLWASKEVDVSPHLQFARPRQVVELSPADAQRLGIGDGDVVEVGSNGTRVTGPVKLRAAIPSGSVFVAVGVTDSPGNVLHPGPVEVRALAGVTAGPVPVTVGAAGDEQPEPPSLESPPGTAAGFSEDGSAPRESGPGEPAA